MTDRDPLPTAEQPRHILVCKMHDYPPCDPREWFPAEHPSGSPQTEEGRMLLRYQPGGMRSEHWHDMIAEVEVAAVRREIGTNPTKHAAWCWLPADHQGQCEGDQ